MRNKKQSLHVISARKNALERFKKARDLAINRRALLQEQIEESFDLMRMAFRGTTISQDKREELIFGFAFDCFIFGRSVERMENFERLRQWMKHGIINSQTLLGYLTKTTKSRKKLAENVELLDVSFGTGYGRRVVFDKVLSRDSKRQIRNTLARRLTERKVKPPLKI